MDELRRAAKLLIDAPDVTLLGHVNPDADAFGSAVGLGLALRGLGATVRVSFGAPDRVPESLRHLDPDGLYVPASEVPAVPPVLVAVDTGDIGRLGVLGDRPAATIAAGGQVVVVDHHVTNTRYGTVNVVDAGAEATTVLILALLDELGASLTAPIASALYAGLLTDTGSFMRATPRTHEMAARLLTAGVDAQATARPLLDAHPFAWLRLLSTVLGRAVLEPSAARGMGLVHTRVELAEAATVRPEDVDRVIDLVRSTKEAEVSVVLKQVNTDEWTVSMRAVSRLDLSAAARAIGGGGHQLASGFTARGSAAEVLDRLRTALDEAPLL